MGLMVADVCMHIQNADAVAKSASTALMRSCVDQRDDEDQSSSMMMAEQVVCGAFAKLTSRLIQSVKTESMLMTAIG